MCSGLFKDVLSKRDARIFITGQVKKLFAKMAVAAILEETIKVHYCHEAKMEQNGFDNFLLRNSEFLSASQYIHDFFTKCMKTISYQKSSESLSSVLSRFALSGNTPLKSLKPVSALPRNNTI